MHFTVAGNTTVVVQGNSTVSNLTSNTVEVIHGATIQRAIYGAGASGEIVVYRGANVVLTLSGSGEIGDVGLPVSAFPQANLTVVLPSNTASLILELSKTFSIMSNVGGY